MIVLQLPDFALPVIGLKLPDIAVICDIALPVIVLQLPDFTLPVIVYLILHSE